MKEGQRTSKTYRALVYKYGRGSITTVVNYQIAQKEKLSYTQDPPYDAQKSRTRLIVRTVKGRRSYMNKENKRRCKLISVQHGHVRACTVQSSETSHNP